MPEGWADDIFIKTIKLIAPGTTLYEGLENILRARTGALLVVGDTPEVLELVDGGFRLDSDLDPSSLYELAKMDGAMVISSDAAKIVYANAQLAPNTSIPTSETGTRHRTAERVAIQTGELVIAISQRRNVITLYKGNMRYVVRDFSVVMAKANQALQTLQKYRSVLDEALGLLTALEFENMVTLAEVTNAIRRAEMVSHVAKEIQWYVYELGTEGRLIEMQLDELMSDIEDEGHLVIRDYAVNDDEKCIAEIKRHLQNWSSEDLLDMNLIAKTLGFTVANINPDTQVAPRGYRILRKIPRVPLPVISNLVEKFSSFQNIFNASIESLDDVEGIGEVRAKAIRNGLKRLREQASVNLDRFYM